ncbi:hypothetical protein BgiBS90_009382, partial [Biomphalaria glabrata]
CLPLRDAANHRAPWTLSFFTSDARSGRSLYGRILVCTQLPFLKTRLPNVGPSCFAPACLVWRRHSSTRFAYSSGQGK